MRTLTLAALLLSAMPAAAQVPEQVPLGRPVEGVSMAWEPSTGKITLNLAPVIVLEGGRELRRLDGMRYEAVTPTSAPPPTATIRGLDLLVSGQDQIGRRVKVTGGTVIAPDVNRGMLQVQGGTVWLDLGSASREIVVRLVERCGSFMPNTSECSFDVIGIVERQRHSNGFIITDVDFEQRSAAPRRR